MASAADREEVVAAGRACRRHWDSFDSMPDIGATFTGAVADIRALDYLDYEQLGHAGDDLRVAALVWANVLVTQSGLTWLRAADGGFWIGEVWEAEKSGYDHDSIRPLLWPLARIAELKARASGQFEQFYALMETAVVEIIDASHDPTIRARLRRLQAVIAEGEDAVAEAERAATRCGDTNPQLTERAAYKNPTTSLTASIRAFCALRKASARGTPPSSKPGRPRKPPPRRPSAPSRPPERGGRVEYWNTIRS